MKTNICIIAGGMAALGAGLTGCTSGNERISQGAYEPDNKVVVSTFADTGGAPPPTSVGASYMDLNRSNWQRTTVLVPADGLASKPFYASEHMYGQATARQRGEQPTALSSLELEGDNPGTRLAEAALAPVWASWDFTRMVLWDVWTNPPFVEHVYPRDPYARAQTTVTRVSGESELSEHLR